MRERLIKRLIVMTAALGMITTSCTGNNDNNKKFNDNPAPEPIHFVYKNKKAGADDDHYLYYTDDYFRTNSTTYNPHLATISVYMSKYSQNPGNPDSLDDNEWYTTQCVRVSKFFEAIGFSNISCNADYYTRTAFDTIGIAVSSRKIDDFTVLACTVRSGGYFLEWENNVFLGDGSKSDMMHEGWYNAANKVIDYLSFYINNFKISGKIKIWMSGFSRGGATINLTAGLLDNKIYHDGSDKVFSGVTLAKENLYAYTFESPQGASFYSTTVEPHESEIYQNIFNIVNPNDMVTKVAMSRMGFTRFGIDKFITTEFFDYDNYSQNRFTAKMLYGDNNEWKADRFTMYGIPFSKWTDVYNIAGLVKDVVDWIIDDDQGGIPVIFEVDETKVNYDPNILMTLILDEAVDNMNNADRSYYANYIQDIARAVMKKTTSDVKIPGTLPIWAYFTEIAFQAIAWELFGNESGIIDIVGETGATSEQVGKTLDVAAAVFATYPNEFATLIANVKDIFENHSTDIVCAHVKAQDSWYIDAFNKGRSAEQGLLKIVPLRDNANLCRFHLYDFNDCRLYTAQDDFKNAKVEIKGSSMEASSIEGVSNGYAAGYYHYASYERINLFFNAEYEHKLYLAEYSLDWDHHCYAEYYWYRTNPNSGDGISYYYQVRNFYDEVVAYSIDEFSVDYPAPAPYVPPTIKDLTGTTWTIEALRSMVYRRSIDFIVVNDGVSRESIACEYYTDHFELYYDDDCMAKAYDPDYRITWMGGHSLAATIKITGGSSVKDHDLIDWLTRNAKQVE